MPRPPEPPAAPAPSRPAAAPAEPGPGARPGTAAAASQGVRIEEITLDAGALQLSALYARPHPAAGEPRAVVVAVHGLGMHARYFHSPAHPDLSLLTLAARLGHPVLAVDRPGHGRLAARHPDGQPLAEQSATLHRALAAFAREHPTGAGFFLLAHSYGGKLALHAAADDTDDTLIGLDISGLGHHYAPAARGFPATLGGGAWSLNWGPMHLYPPGTFQGARALMAPTPRREEHDPGPPWPLRYRQLAPRVRVPVRLTFAEHEQWWHTDDAALSAMAARLNASPRVRVDRQDAAGHNISLGWAARPYHLRALAFLEECLRR
ncbi:alpha/beta fold hydrolase [Streptomyces sp. Tu 2975]|uniref:alpha/beta hydrolase n=1 Tax=Streptomyces sp. Tu 2975 TaxID=2676871 RepID=UPI001FC9CC32|nr:alpha/beta fold hydrolase [Streptomyces sp. Tu 2975]